MDSRDVINEYVSGDNSVYETNEKNRISTSVFTFVKGYEKFTFAKGNEKIITWT